MNRQVVVAVDGGGSKTDVAVVDIATGEVIGTSRGAGCSHHQIGIEATVAVLDEAVTAALMNAGVQPTDVVHAGCYLTSIDFDSEQVAVHAAVSTMPGAAPSGIAATTSTVARSSARAVSRSMPLAGLPVSE